MKLKSPDLPAIEPPHKIERSMTEAKENFYELAKSRTSFLDHKQFKAWVEKYMGVLGIYLRQDEDAAFFKISTGTAKNETTDIEKFICELEIVIDKEKFFLDGEDYSDIIPFITEHEIYEAWLHAKRGTLQTKQAKEAKHTLSLMREFVMAEEKGLGEKLLNWRKKIDPHSEEVYKNMSEYAKNKIKGGKKPAQIDKDIDNMFKQSETYETEYVEHIYLANIIEGEIGRHLFELFKNKDKKEYFAFENEANQIHDEFYKLTEEHKGQVISEADLAEVQKKLTAFAIKHNINPELLSLRKALKIRHKT